MTIRTSKRTVTFSKPFVLVGVDEMLPPGAYEVETDEELLEPLSFAAYRRIATLIHIGETRSHPGVKRTVTIDPNDLDAALKRDQAYEDSAVGSAADHGTPEASSHSCREEPDLRDVERAEDEGRIAHPK